MTLDDDIAPKNAPRWRRIAVVAGIAATIATALSLTLYWEDTASFALLGQPDKNRVDLFAEGVRGLKFDSDGKLVETLRAQRLDHYPRRNESILAQPALESLGNDGKIWNTTAEVGVLVGDDEIRLEKNVVIVDREKTTRFESETLTYFSAKQEATTDAPVKLRHVADVTTAIGMRVNLKTNRIELLSHVDSHYAQK